MVRMVQFGTPLKIVGKIKKSNRLEGGQRPMNKFMRIWNKDWDNKDGIGVIIIVIFMFIVIYLST
jgi:hypothetical protein